MSDSNDQPPAISPSMPSANPIDSSEDSNAALSQQGPILPVELVNLVARFLYESRSLKTIAQLNRTSKTVREETLSALYETVVYKCVPSFIRTVSFNVLPGWKYTRNLLLSDTAYQLLLQHLRFMAHLKLLPSPALEEAFPKLDLVAITSHKGETKLKLYKPLSLADILDRLKTDRFKEPSFFGTTVNRKAAIDVGCCPGCQRSLESGMETITELELQDRAYLLPGTSGDVEGFQADDPTKLVNFRLVAHEPPEDYAAAKEGVKQIMQTYRTAQEKNAKVKDMKLHISVPLAWCDVLVEALAELAPMHVNISVTVNTPLTSLALRKIIVSLADVFASNWSAAAADSNLQRHFVVMHGHEQDSPPMTTANEPAAHPAIFMASLELGHWAENPNGAGASQQQKGFGAHVYRLEHGIAEGRVPAPEALFYQAYPCEAAYTAAGEIENA